MGALWGAGAPSDAARGRPLLLVDQPGSGSTNFRRLAAELAFERHGAPAAAFCRDAVRGAALWRFCLGMWCVAGSG